MGKHIVIDARELRSSTGRYVERLLHYLQKIDHDNDYSVLLKPADIPTWQPTNKRFKSVACPHKEFTLAEQLGLLRQVKSLKPDLVHFGKDHQPVLYGGRVVTTMHDLTTARFTNPAKNRLVFAFKQLVYKSVVKRVAKKSAAIITGSQFVKDDLVAFTGVTPDKIFITHEAADKIEDTPEPVAEVVGKEFIMYVGRPTPHKNLDRLVEAFAKLSGQQPELRLVLAGKLDANYQSLQAKVKKACIKRVIFTDFVSEGQLRWLYENCQAYVFPSLSEGFGLPGLEAMIHNAPVISSNATCLPEIYGSAAHYFNPLDIDSVADAINEVLTDKNLRQELVKKGQSQAAKYSWQRMAEQTLAVYQKAMG